MRKAIYIAAILAVAGFTQAKALEYNKPVDAKASFQSKFDATSPSYNIGATVSALTTGYLSWLDSVQSAAVSYATSSSYDPTTKTLSGSYSVQKYNDYLAANGTYNQTSSKVEYFEGGITYSNPGYAPYTGAYASINSTFSLVINGLTGAGYYFISKDGYFSQSNPVMIGPDLDIESRVSGMFAGYVQTAGADLTQTFKKFAPSPFGNSSQTVKVPGPEAGAGLGALAMGGMAFWVKRRRKAEALAA